MTETTPAAGDEVMVTPCPFCGSPGKLIHPMGYWQSKEVGYGPDGSRITCTGCTVYGEAFYGPDQDAQAIAWWETRARLSPPEPTPVAAGEVLPESAPGHWDTAGGREMALRALKDANMARNRARVSDFQLANDVFLSPGIANLTDAKERIRWLSAQLALRPQSPAASDKLAVAVPQWFVDGFATLDDPDQGLSWTAAHYGRRKFDPDTGKEYYTRSEPETLRVYGARAAFLYRMICQAKALHTALATLQAAGSGDGGEG